MPPGMRPGLGRCPLYSSQRWAVAVSTTGEGMWKTPKGYFEHRCRMSELLRMSTHELRVSPQSYSATLPEIMRTLNILAKDVENSLFLSCLG
jgi:hypothetical protein